MRKKPNLKTKLNALLILLVILLINIYAIDFTEKASNTSSKQSINNNDESVMNAPEISIYGEDPWWNVSYSHRRLINITNNNDADLEDYTVSVKFNHTELMNDVPNGMQADLGDLRIVENEIIRNYYVQTDYPNGDMATVWFETNISANSEEYDTYLYYGTETTEVPESHYKGDRAPQNWWRFEEGIGFTADDSIGNNNGTLNNMQVNDWVTGKLEDYCLDLDGDDDYISMDSDTIPEDDFSISLWFYARSSTGTIYDQSMGAPYYSGSGQKYFAIYLNNGELSWTFEDGNDGDWRIYHTLTNPTDTWHHVAVTAEWETSSGNHSIWVDGELVATDINNIQSKPYLNAPYIGDPILDGYEAPNVNFEGMIDDIRIYDYRVEGEDMDWLYTSYKVDTSLNEEQPRSASMQVNAIDLYGNYIPYAEISIYSGTALGTPLQTKTADSDGSVIFGGLNVTSQGYNFSVSISSNTIPGYFEVVNRTTKAFPLEDLFDEINLTCDVGTNIFNVIDVDGDPVISGWIMVGNSTPGYGEIRNCTIDSSGIAQFWWVNSTPYEYNYTVYYQNENYYPSELILATGEFNTPNTPIPVTTNLTTINFTVFRRDIPTEVIKEINLRIRANLTGNNYIVVDLNTDVNGKATLRWLNSSDPLINGNYSIECRFFDDPKDFNMTELREGDTNFLSDVVSFNVTSKKSYSLWVDINPGLYTTELTLLNPDSNIEVTWDTQLKLRALLNITSVGGGEEKGFIDADSMTYKVKRGTTTILTGNMLPEENNKGRHQGIIDTSQLEGGKSYAIEISAQKTGFTAPPTLNPTLLVLKNAMMINQSENDDSSIDVYWLESANMTVKPYGKNSEHFIIEENIFKEPVSDGYSFDFSIPDIETDWNLSQVEFSIKSVTFGTDINSAYITITETNYGIQYTWDKDNATIGHYGDFAPNGTWNDVILNLDKASLAGNNLFNFEIVGSFIGSIDVTAESNFVRDKMHVEYSEFNVTDSIIIQPDGNGWTIQNITFEISNCLRTSDWQPYDLSDINSLNITTNEEYKYSLNPGGGPGYGSLTIDNRTTYPFSYLDNRFLFAIENNTNIVFDVIIRVEYIQEFYETQYLEEISTTIVRNGYISGDISITPTDIGWNDNGVTLLITNLKNGTGISVLPSEVGLNITFNSQTSDILSLIPGEATHLLGNIPKEVPLFASIYANQFVTFDLTFKISYSRDVYYDISATITYEIRGEDLVGSAPYVSGSDYYRATIDTSPIDADDYTIRFYGTTPNYNLGQIDLDLNVLERLTLINGQTGFLQQVSTIYVQTSAIYTFSYTDQFYGTNITNLDEQSYFWKYYDTGGSLISEGFDYLTTNSQNQYVLDFNTRLRPSGSYQLFITLDKQNYEEKIAIVALTIDDREIDYDLGDMFEDKQVSVVKGEKITLEIELTDPLNDQPIKGAKVVLEIGDDDFEFDEEDDGVYELEFDTKEYEAFFTSNTLTGTIKISKANYTTEEVDITIVVEMEEVVEGVPTFYFLMIVSAIAAIVGSLATYKFIQIARIPTFVKKARKIKKAIKANDEISESLMYPSKEEFMVKALESNYNILGVSLADQLGVKIKKKKILSEKTIEKDGGNI